MYYTKNEMLEKLRAAGRRITGPRLAIIKFIAGRGDHPSARQIYNQVQRKSPGISLATVYNTLIILRDLDLVKEIEFEHTENRYDTNLQPHLNLVCKRCGAIRDVEFTLPLILEDVRRREGFITSDFRIELHGLCASCSHKSG